MDLVIKANVFATCAMFGAIWIVQLVHYPMFAAIDEKSFLNWHTFHSNRISYVVGPIMVMELLVSIWLLWLNPATMSSIILGLTLAIWAATFFVSVPLHTQLGLGSRERQLIKKLVATNWIRTILYTLKVGVVFFAS